MQITVRAGPCAGAQSQYCKLMAPGSEPVRLEVAPPQNAPEYTVKGRAQLAGTYLPGQRIALETCRSIITNSKSSLKHDFRQVPWNCSCILLGCIVHRRRVHRRVLSGTVWYVSAVSSAGRLSCLITGASFW
eukprot:scaffold106_cov380-Prasinococcus_capsulatus_cf.AAC.64